MSVLTIRTHRRYAVRQEVEVGKACGACETGLLIELSSEGCRISNLGRGGYSIGDEVTLDLGDRRLPGKIRWAHDGIAGVRLDSALFGHELNAIVARGREDSPLARYGT
jgi:hypothetical protein